MILFIHVRAENSVALNFPCQKPGRPKDQMMPGAVNLILSWIPRMDKRSPCVSRFSVRDMGCTVSAPLLQYNR